MREKRINEKYEHLVLDEFEFSDRIIYPQSFFKNEDDFMWFIILNEWFGKKIGICNIVRNHGTPDIYANIIGSTDKIGIEVEYNAINFSRHKHKYWTSDLILSFIRNSRNCTVSGIPVWSVYEYTAHNEYTYCLDKDINYSFT